MADIEQMTSEERVRWVLATPRSERPERGPLPKLGFWKELALSDLPDDLRNEVVDGFLTQEEALNTEIERIGRMPPEERVEYVLSTPSYERPKKGPLEGETISSSSGILSEIGGKLTYEVEKGYLTLEEAKSVAEERKEAKRAAKARKEEKRAAEAEHRAEERAAKDKRKEEEQTEREAELDPTILHIEQMTDEERVQWVINTPRSKRPEQGPLPKLGFWKDLVSGGSHNLPDHLRGEVDDMFLTRDEAEEIERERIGQMSSQERVEYVLSMPREKRPSRGPLPELGAFADATIMFMDEDILREARNGYLTVGEAKSVVKQRKEEEQAAEAERQAELEPILHVISMTDELKVHPGYLEWGSRWMKMGKFNTLPFSRIQKIERRRSEYGFLSRSLYIVTTDGSDIELWSIGKEDAEFVTRTIYRAMGGDHTKVGKINLAD